MEVIIVKTQEELDALPARFEQYTIIEVRSETRVSVKKARGNCIVEARENSHVEAWENSHVLARENSHVLARENSHVEAWGNSHVEARENSHVEARENSHVEARENSHVEAWGNSHVLARGDSHVEARGNSHVEAWGNSHVEARGKSHVEAWGNSHVLARGNSHVEAWGNCIVRVMAGIKLKLKQFATAVCVDSNPTVIECDSTAHIHHIPVVKYDKRSFMGIYSDNVQADGRIFLYKTVRDDGTDFFTGKIKYAGVVECPDWDPDCNRQCGGGLHLSPSPSLATSYNKGKILRCLVHPDDFVVYPHDITKVRCRKVEVLED